MQAGVGEILLLVYGCVLHVRQTTLASLPLWEEVLFLFYQQNLLSISFPGRRGEGESFPQTCDRVENVLNYGKRPSWHRSWPPRKLPDRFIYYYIYCLSPPTAFKAPCGRNHFTDSHKCGILPFYFHSSQSLF